MNLQKLIQLNAEATDLIEFAGGREAVMKRLGSLKRIAKAKGSLGGIAERDKANILGKLSEDARSGKLYGGVPSETTADLFGKQAANNRSQANDLAIKHGVIGATGVAVAGGAAYAMRKRQQGTNSPVARLSAKLDGIIALGRRIDDDDSHLGRNIAIGAGAIGTAGGGNYYYGGQAAMNRYGSEGGRAGAFARAGADIASKPTFGAQLKGVGSHYAATGRLVGADVAGLASKAWEGAKKIIKKAPAAV